MLGTQSYDPDGLHAGVGETCIAGVLRETLHGVLKRVDCRGEVLLEDLVYN